MLRWRKGRPRWPRRRWKNAMPRRASSSSCTSNKNNRTKSITNSNSPPPPPTRIRSRPHGLNRGRSRRSRLGSLRAALTPPLATRGPNPSKQQEPAPAKLPLVQLVQRQQQQPTAPVNPPLLSIPQQQLTSCRGKIGCFRWGFRVRWGEVANWKGEVP
jgi:hypothetical protein